MADTADGDATVHGHGDGPAPDEQLTVATTGERRAMNAGVDSQPTSPSAAKATAAADADAPVCRVCRCDDAEDRLYTPCLCRGSISHVHQECLLQWLLVALLQL